MPKMRWAGPGIYSGADQYVHGSLTCYPGEVYEISQQKVQELLDEDPGWTLVNPPAKAEPQGDGLGGGDDDDKKTSTKKK